MAEVFDVDNAINDIVNEFITIDDSTNPIDLVLDDTEFSDSIKKKIREEFGEVLSKLNFSTKGFDIIRKWYVDGLMYYHIIVDENNKKKGILKLNALDPRKIKLVRQIDKQPDENGLMRIKSINEFYVYSDQFYVHKNQRHMTQVTNQTFGLNKSSVCYINSGIVDVENNLIRGHLHKAIKPLNQLSSVEDALVIYRLSRAPERRIFYVDVGSLPKTKAEQYLQKLMNRYKSKLSYDPRTGAVKDSANTMSMLEDFWLPRREGGKGTEVSNLQGGQNLGEIEDIIYFQKRLYKSLNVPISRMEGESILGIGKQSEITRDELKFNKFVARLRVRFNELFNFLLKTQLILKNIITEQEWEDNVNNIRYDYQQDFYLAEQQEAELHRDRFDVMQQAENYIGTFISKKWAAKHILRLSEEDMEQMQKEIEEEAKEAEAKGEEDTFGDDTGGQEVPEEKPEAEPEKEKPDNDNKEEE